jgi:PAS domain S-box-containing protein
VKELFDFLLILLSQFAGGPGPVENSLVRFGLAAIFWAVLLSIAWSRQRSVKVPREKLLVWGFGLALVRELYLFGQIAGRVITKQTETSCSITEPIEHALSMIAVVVVAGAFLRYMLDDPVLSRRYLWVGLSIAGASLLATAIIWPPWWSSIPGLRFHQTWLAWLFHLPLSVMIIVAIYYLWRKPGWLRNVVSSALGLFFLSEVLFLLNYSTARAYANILCPVGNGLHIFAIPLLGYVYLREQQLEKEQAEAGLRTYREHLEELVDERTAELTNVNDRLKQEVFERSQAEEALARISQRDELILTSAGEGICGIDKLGHLTFVNPAAAAMLGYSVDELINQQSHAIWHCRHLDGTPYKEEDCPICACYQKGTVYRSDDENFYRQDGRSFPVRVFSTPTYEKGALAGAVVVYQDITERKRQEEEIAQRNASLAIQNAVAAALSQSLDVKVSIKSALEMLLERLSIDVGMIFFYDPASEQLSLELSSGALSYSEIRNEMNKDCPYWQISNQALSAIQAVVLPEFGAPADQHVAYSGGKIFYYLMSAPLVSKGKAVGVITLGSIRPDPIGPHDLDLLTAIGQQMGMAIENARLYKDAEQRSVDLIRLQDASSLFAASLDENRVTRLVAEQSAWLMECQMACVLRRNNHSNQLELAASFGMNTDVENIIQNHLGEWEKKVELPESPRLIRIHNARTDPQVPVAWVEKLRICSILCLPVWGTDQPLMYLCIFETNRTRKWDPQELELITNFAARAAVTLMNARLHKQAEMAAALEERQRIAADMHDGLAQTLGLLGLKVDEVSERVAEGPDQITFQAMQSVRETVIRASAEVRQSIASLREAPKPLASLQDQITQLIERQSGDDLPRVEFINRLEKPLFLSKDHLQQVIPLLQEALLNACHHAHATTIHVRLVSQDGSVQVSVEDDGVGFDPNTLADTENHFGLSIMQARAGRIGGQLVIDSAHGQGHGQGTRIHLTWQPDIEGTPNLRIAALERLG